MHPNYRMHLDTDHVAGIYPGYGDFQLLSFRPFRDMHVNQYCKLDKQCFYSFTHVIKCDSLRRLRCTSRETEFQFHHKVLFTPCAGSIKLQ